MKTASLLLAVAALVIVGFVGIQSTESDVSVLPSSSGVLTFEVDKAHSNIGFRVRHLGISNVNGNFGDYEATVEVDPSDLSTLKAKAVVQIASIDTGIERRDNHLRSDDFFNAEMYPKMEFVGKRVQSLDGDSFELVGDLTIRDVEQEVVLEGEFLGMGEMQGTKKIGFEAETTINRFDYNLKWDRLTEAGGLVVAEKVKIVLDLELNEKKAINE